MGRSSPRSRPDPVASSTPADEKVEPWDRDFIRVAPSAIDGTGVFAKRPIHRGARIIEYVGERLRADRLLALDDPATRTYIFRLDDEIVIDGSRGGNASRFINHSCAPNCEVYAFDDRLFIYALADIPAGEELTFDYKLSPPPGLEGDGGTDLHICRCGAPACRGSMRQIRVGGQPPS